MMFRFFQKHKQKKAEEEKTTREAYCSWVSTFCSEYAQFHQLKMAVEDGEVVSPEEIQTALSRTEISIHELLCKKIALGLSGGLDFLNDNAFKGFEIKNGQLVTTDDTDIDTVYAICTPWYMDYVEGRSDNHYKFEVASLILSLVN